jgi:hypothetical protein
MLRRRENVKGERFDRDGTSGQENPRNLLTTALPGLLSSAVDILGR